MAEPEVVLVDEPSEDVVVEDDVEEKEKPSFSYDIEAPNLVEEFVRHPKGRLELKRLADEFAENFDDAWASSEEYRERRAEEWKFFAGTLDKKKFPFEGCANGHVPIMMENISRIVTRAYGELFPDRNNVFGVVPVGPDDEDIAQALSVHGNWQLAEQIPNFYREQHRGLLMFFAHGDVVCHSFYDIETERNHHEMLTSDEFVIPYARVTTCSDYADVPYLCKKLQWFKHELKAKDGEWHGVRAVLAKTQPSWMGELETPMADAVDEATGLVKPDKDTNAPYTIILYEGWAELPGQERARWVQAYFDYDTRAIMFLTVHEEPNWQDLQRYQDQLSDLERYNAESAAYSMAMQGQAELETANELAVAEAQNQAEVYETDAAAQVALGMVDPMTASMQLDAMPLAPPTVPVPPPPPEPVMPAWMESPLDTPTPPRYEPIRLFAHGVCIESLAGNLGLSYGRVQAGFNSAANVALNQFIDAATLGNMGMYLAAPNVQFSDTPFQVKPGGVVYLKSLGGVADVKQALQPFQFQSGNPQLIQVMDKMYQYGQSSMQAPSVLSGEPGKSGETYRGISARIEQATKQLSVFTGKYATEFLEQILKNNAKLNARFLREEEMFSVTDHLTEKMTMQSVRREWYARNYRVKIRADLRFATQSQRVAEADEALQLVATDPMMAHNYRLQYEVRRKALEARGRSDLIPFLGAPPPVSQQFPAPPPAPPPPPPGQPPQQGGQPQQQGQPPGPPPQGGQPPGPPSPPPGQPPQGRR